MKKWIVAVVVLAACLLVAPVGLGKLAEKRVNSGLDKLVTQAPWLTIADRSWDGGWFRSQQTVTFELSSAMRDLVVAEAGADAPVPTRFVVHNAVLHGPVLGAAGIGVARLDSTLDLPEAVVAKIREVFGPDPAITIRTRLGFLNGARTTVASEGRTVQLPDGDSLTYSDFHLSVAVDEDVDTYDVDGGWPKLEAKRAAGGSVLIEDITIDGDGHRVKGSLYDGAMVFNLGSLKVTEPGGKTFAIEDIRYDTGIDSKDGYTGIFMRIGAGDVESADATAAGFDIESVHYDVAFRHLHTDTIVALIDKMKDVYAGAAEVAGANAGVDANADADADANADADADSSADAEADADADAAAIAQAMASATMADALMGKLFSPLKEDALVLLQHNPEFAVERISLDTANGDALIKGLVKLVGMTADDLSPAALDRTLTKIDADFTVEVDRTLIEKLPNGAMMSGAALDSGFVKREGDKLVSHLVLRNGEVTINDKAVPIPGLSGLAGGGVAPPPPQGAAPL